MSKCDDDEKTTHYSTHTKVKMAHQFSKEKWFGFAFISSWTLTRPLLTVLSSVRPSRNLCMHIQKAHHSHGAHVKQTLCKCDWEWEKKEGIFSQIYIIGGKTKSKKRNKFQAQLGPYKRNQFPSIFFCFIFYTNLISLCFFSRLLSSQTVSNLMEKRDFTITFFVVRAKLWDRETVKL